MHHLSLLAACASVLGVPFSTAVHVWASGRTIVDPSQQWQHPQQGQPGPQYPQQGQPQYPQQPQQPQPQYPQQQYPPAQPQYPPQQQYPNQPYSAQPYTIAPNSAAPYSGPPANPYAAPSHLSAPLSAPPSGPPRPRNRLVPILIVGAVLVTVLVVAIVVVALGRDKEQTAGPGATTSASASYSGPVDPCLVGTWKQTSYQKVVDLTGTDVDKREGIGKVKMTGGGKVWTIKADGSAVEDDAKTVYSGEDDKGRTINATFSGTTDWAIKTVGRTIEYAGKDSTSSVVISVDGRKAGTINLEPNLDPNNYTCVGDVWRTSKTDDPDSFARYDKVK
jgi:hypothetical protein